MKRRREAKTDAALAQCPDLSTRSSVNDRSVRWNHAKLIGEYARQSGHADIIPERIDGATGEQSPRRGISSKRLTLMSARRELK